ncbi:hypothetical protein A5777_12745 [Gordonia sp. 852002-10350_SCH5691597]|nr:hypothetical protein A5766_21500 [Gordonia sp. 852002-51296_SCH5728562-b]OBA70790.1 hypothetical protein A5777_12745 [Gordonia sp. 852002-10350_SCH5691597]
MAAVVGIVLAGSLVQGVSGSGFGVVTAPALLMVAPQLVPTTLLCLATVACGFGAWRERTHIDWAFVSRCLIAAVPGTATGLVAVHLVAAPTLEVGIATAVILGGVAGLCGARVPLSHRGTVAAGFLSGALNYAAALPGPPLALTYRTPDAAQIRATLSAVFTMMSLATSIVVTTIGRGGIENLKAAALLAAPLAVGIAFGRRIAPWVSATWTARAGMSLSVLAGLGLLLNNV